MAYDGGLAQVLRDDLAGEPFREQKMFGGLCFLIAGNMVADVYSGGGMFRVARGNRATALCVPGAEEIRMGARVMFGLSAKAMADDAARGRLMALALTHVRGLPPK